MFNWFNGGKNVIRNPKILLCVIGNDALHLDCLQQDKAIYQSYQDIAEYRAAGAADFFAFLHGKQYDIVHVLANIDEKGNIAGRPGIQLLQRVSEAGTKVFLIASDNPMENYVAAFPAEKRNGADHMNMILTFERKGGNFTEFFRSLFGLMAPGKTMPMAWVKLAPQHHSMMTAQMPETVFEANCGHIKLVP